MKNNINIAEILRECPKGMKLYSPIFGDVYLDEITPNSLIMVTCDKEQGDFKAVFYHNGKYTVNGDCLLFPSKDKTTWEGFVPPGKFKDGDILYIDCTGDECSYKHNKYIFILKEISDGKIYCYCYIDEVNKYKKFNISWLSDMTYTPRFATEEEKQKLFDAIKENGYKWNAETKTLEKLVAPKFKVGDRIRRINDVDKYGGIEEGIIDTITDNKYGIVIPHLMGIVTLINITDQDNWELVALKFKTGDRIRRKIKRRNYIDEGEIKNVSFNFYDVFTTDEKSISIPIREQDEWELVPDKIEPNFKVGDIIQDNEGYKVEITSVEIDDECYMYLSKIANGIGAIDFKNQHEWVLVPDKFDISTLVPFESRVLVRHTKDEIWKPAIFGCYNGYRYYVLGNVHWVYCIPYEGNEHLCGKTDDCDEYYKTWED